MTTNEVKDLKERIRHGNLDALSEYLKYESKSRQTIVNKTSEFKDFRWHQGGLDAILLILDLLPKRI